MRPRTNYAAMVKETQSYVGMRSVTRRSDLDGQREVKGGALRGVVCCPKAAAMRFNNGAADPKAHTDAMGFDLLYLH
jgi:hypothetical protein